MASIIRSVTPEDAPALLRIYAPYVERTAISFEVTPPSEAEFRRRIGTILEKYPYLCLEEEGNILGYAYAAPYRSRAAYRWTAELSIYLAPEAAKKGSGRRLLGALESACRAMGLRILYACVALPEGEDPYLDDNSIGFHEHMGYVRVGLLRRSGRKFGRWYHTAILEKSLAEGSEPVREVTWFPALSETNP